MNSGIINITGVFVQPKYMAADDIARYLSSDGHAYLSLAICFTGLAVNILNVIVLTQQPMRSPTNLLLCSIAVADLLTIFLYVPKIAIGRASRTMAKSLGFAYYKLVFAHLSLLSHTVSVWLTVSLCLFRCLIVLSANGKKYSNYTRTVGAVCFVTFVTPLLQLPSFILLNVHSVYEDQHGKMLTANEVTDNNTLEMTKVWIVNIKRDTDTATEEERARDHLYHLQLWVVAILGKLIPCILLAIMSSLLIRKLCQVQSNYNHINKEERNTLAAQSKCGHAPSSTSAVHAIEDANNRCCHTSEGIGQVKCTHRKAAKSRRSSQTNRTTAMLLVMVITFIIAEFPIALLLLLSQVLGEEYFDNTYLKIAGIFDLLIILNCSSNFIIYCVMSEQFRKTFTQIFCWQPCARIAQREGRPCWWIRGYLSRNEAGG